MSCPVIFSDFLLNTGISYENFAETTIHVQLYVLKTACKGLVYIFFAAQLPRHFVLIPNKSIYVLRGRSGEVTCEAEGPSVSTLKWEKEQDDKSYAAVPNSQVNITKDTNYVRATLKITNAQFADTGTYKCTVSVPPNKLDYKLTKIEVKGMFVLYFFVKVTFTVSISSFLQYMAHWPAHQTHNAVVPSPCPALTTKSCWICFWSCQDQFLGLSLFSWLPPASWGFLSCYFLFALFCF